MNTRNECNNKKHQDDHSFQESLSSKTSIIDLRMVNEEDIMTKFNQDAILAQRHATTSKPIDHQNHRIEFDSKSVTQINDDDSNNNELQSIHIPFKYHPFVYCDYFKYLSDIWNDHEYISDFNDDINNKKEGKIAKIPIAKLSSYSNSINELY